MFRRDGTIRAFALVDAGDFEWACSRRWYLGRDGYAYRNLSHRTEGRGHVAMHRELLGLGRGDPREGDHINLNRLDNRRENLRVVPDGAANKQNVPARSGARGVSFHRQSGRWRARVIVGGVEHAFGYYETEIEAADAAAAGRKLLMPFTIEREEATT